MTTATRTRSRSEIEDAAQRAKTTFCCHTDAVAREWCNGGDECTAKAAQLVALRAEWRTAR
jgi:hypothetical protein